MALWDGRAVKEYQKPWFRPRPWGSITTGWSWQPSDPPFQKMTRIQALQAAVTFWPVWNTGPLFAPYSWFITVFCESVNWLASFSVFLQELDRMCRYTLILIRAYCLCIYVSSSLRNFDQIQLWKHEEFGTEKSKLPSHRITNAVTGSNFELQTKQHFRMLSIRPTFTSMHIQSLSTWFEVVNWSVLANKLGLISYTDWVC